MALSIKQYIFKYIQNLNKILADLKQANIIIIDIKFWFF